ncbi:MAG: hypothetical protein CM15mP73_5520 [Hyphomicrobiales bacterium]|nr:MAG: hypothetical protein CM15mP73_5520 [Hyphomicrobiales bacterium]
MIVNPLSIKITQIHLKKIDPTPSCKLMMIFFFPGETLNKVMPGNVPTFKVFFD